MGNVSSKAPRKPPRLASSRIEATTERVRPPRPERPLAFESKNEAVEQDAKDPQFMEKLSQLGQVRVDHHMQAVRTTTDDVQSMYRSRIHSETEASSMQPTRNRLLASSLTELLEARKSITDSVQLEALAKRYHVDAAKLEQLGRIVNTASIDERTVVRTTDEHGEESVTMTAQWIDPALSRAQ